MEPPGLLLAALLAAGGGTEVCWPRPEQVARSAAVCTVARAGVPAPWLPIRVITSQLETSTCVLLQLQRLVHIAWAVGSRVTRLSCLGAGFDR